MRNEVLRFERIRNLRIDRGLTQNQIAEMVGVSQNTYSQYEVGVLNYPLDVVIRLARYYGTSTDYLLELTDESKPYPRRKGWKLFHDVIFRNEIWTNPKFKRR